LPDGWKWASLSQVGKWTGGGTPSKQNKLFWDNGKIFWVSPKDMKSKVIIDTIDKITRDAVDHSSAKLIEKGSILFVVRSGILRRTLPVAITETTVTVNQDIQALTPEVDLPDYIYWCVQGFNNDIRNKCSKDGTTVESIESSLLKNYLIPIAPLPEQYAIVQEIESRLSVCDKIEESIEQSLRQSEALRQSILKKAFEGKLVPQDPHDEPASVLLERIKAGRERNKLENPPHRQARKIKAKKAKS
jgi:type I restriction enzyme S subunit